MDLDLVAKIQVNLAEENPNRQDEVQTQAVELWRATQTAEPRSYLMKVPSLTDCYGQFLQSLPQGTEVSGFDRLMLTPNALTYKMTTKLKDTTHNYFLKVSHNDGGITPMAGEYYSMSAIQAAVPGLCPTPTMWGRLDSDPRRYFYLCDFRNLSRIPFQPESQSGIEASLVTRIAELHRNGLSPTGKFGFRCPTYHGSTPVPHCWADTWEEYFVRSTRTLLGMEAEVNGQSEELHKLVIPFLEDVIPRLLKPLERDDRSITPCLLHGDLWDGNTALDVDTGRPMIFDGACFYGHHEFKYDLAVWRANWTKFSEEHIQMYLRLYPKSAPQEEFDDRLNLYGVRVNILDSILYPLENDYKQNAINGMKFLIAKYGDPS